MAACSPARDQDADGVQTIVLGAVEDESGRVSVAQGRALLPVSRRQQVAQARAPVAVEDDPLDVLTGRLGKRRPTLQQVGAEALQGQPALTQRGERALPPFLERELAAFVTAPLHLGL